MTVRHTPQAFCLELSPEDRAALERIVVRATGKAGRLITRADMMRHLIRAADTGRVSLGAAIFSLSDG